MGMTGQMVCVCGKLLYPTQGQVQRALTVMRGRKRETGCHVYRCRKADAFHIGHAPFSSRNDRIARSRALFRQIEQEDLAWAN
jgi:hypothetical protein